MKIPTYYNDSDKKPIARLKKHSKGEWRGGEGEKPPSEVNGRATREKSTSGGREREKWEEFKRSLIINATHKHTRFS